MADIPEQYLWDEGWASKFMLSLFFGPDQYQWSEFAHRMTGWRYWPQPIGEAVRVGKDIRTADQRSSVPWQTSVRPDGTVVAGATLIGYTTHIYEGTYNGEPLQVGAFNGSGDVATRSVTHGYRAFGDTRTAWIPLPASGRYLHCGDPTVASDRHTVVVSPDTGDVHELIQFDDQAGVTPLANQALGWGRWSNGELVEGDAVTATKLPIHRYTWDRRSRERGGHRLGLVVGDYVGADGTLTSGPVAGMVYYLPDTAPSYKAMVALGGECEAIARSANVNGLGLVDRNGYQGGKLRAPGLWVQWGSWARGTNLDRLAISVTELRMTTERL